MTIEERRAEILRRRLLNQRLANAKFSDYQTPMGGPRRGALRDSTLGVLSDVISNDENDLEQEINLKNVLLLNPKNDEAIYMLVLLKIKQSDYNQAKELIDQFILICKSFCSKKNEMQEKLKKLTPKNAETNN